MTYVERAVKELQFEYDLYNSLFTDDEFYGAASEAEEGGATTPATTPATTSATTTSATTPATSGSTDSKSNDKTPNNPGDNKSKPNSNGNIGLVRRLEEIVKYLGEMITRAITTMQEKTLKVKNNGEAFTKSMKQWAKNKKPNFNLKIVNYVYKDEVFVKASQISTPLLEKVRNKKADIMESYIKYAGANIDDDEFDTALTNIDNNYPELSDLYTYIAKEVTGTDKEKVDGAGGLYEIIRREFHSDKDKESRVLTRNELEECIAFIESYEKYVTKFNKLVTDNKAQIDAFKNEVNRVKSFNASNKNVNNLSKHINEYTQQMTFLTSFQTFVLSLMQERFVNCQLVVKRAYGIK